MMNRAVDGSKMTIMLNNIKNGVILQLIFIKYTVSVV